VLAGIAKFPVERFSGCDLKQRQNSNDFLIDIGYFFSEAAFGPVFTEEFKKRRIAQIFLKVDALGQVFVVDFRDRKAEAFKMFGKFQEGLVFQVVRTENADDTETCF